MHVPDIDLDLVRCFVTVVESGGFTQASKRLHLTQSAITLKIKRLEDLLGQRLFFKTAPPLELTLEGEIVLGYAFRLLELNREMVTPSFQVRRDDDDSPRCHFPLWLSSPAVVVVRLQKSLSADSGGDGYGHDRRAFKELGRRPLRSCYRRGWVHRDVPVQERPEVS